MTAYVRDLCPTCGNLKSVCSDPEQTWYPQRVMCYATAVRELNVRRAAKRYAAEPGTADLHPLDGMDIWTSTDDLTPDDDFV